MTGETPTNLLSTAFAALTALFAGAVAHAQDAPRAEPVVVELFMSQSCSSCVVASDYLHELAARDDVVALNWHVDYWNMLDTKHGRWVDPYSDHAYTKRQKLYNKNIRHRTSVYTPQIVIGGVSEAPGSVREKVNTKIDEARATQRPAEINARRDGGDIVFDIGESRTGGNAYLVALHPEVTTDIPRGENAGRTLSEVNVVAGVQPLGVVRRIGAQLTAPAPDDGMSCALIVQEPRQGRIIAASYCP